MNSERDLSPRLHVAVMSTRIEAKLGPTLDVPQKTPGVTDALDELAPDVTPKFSPELAAVRDACLAAQSESEEGPFIGKDIYANSREIGILNAGWRWLKAHNQRAALAKLLDFVHREQRPGG